MPFTTVNPATGETVGSHPAISLEEARTAASAAAAAVPTWRDRAFPDRAEILRRAAAILEEEADRFADLMAEEMGKPVREGRSEAKKCAWVLEYYAEHGEDFLADHPVALDDVEGVEAFWCYRPLGVVLAIMPWNFPLWQVFRAAAPALMAGNGVLLKHAPNVPGCARACEEILHRAGLPPALFRNLFLAVEDTSELMAHDAVQGVSLTGSVEAGRAVAARAGELLKKCVLELGGSDPYVVLSDADVTGAAETCATARLINGGQSCIAAKRLIVVDEHHDAFVELLRDRFQAVVRGDPFDPETEMGPMAREDLREELHRQVTESVAAGARRLLGGVVPQGEGWWYPPTILTGVEAGMPAYEEELFGPVAAVIRARDDDDALRIANDTRFGLGAAVFTADPVAGRALARNRLEAGACFVNDFVRSDPRLPFGGIRESGYGRELSPLGIREFVNVKTVWVKG